MGAVRLDSIQHSTSIMLSVVAVTLLAALANASPQFYGQYGYQFGTPIYGAYQSVPVAPISTVGGVNPVGYQVTKERLQTIMSDVQGFIDSFGSQETSAKFKNAIPAIMAMVENSIAQTAHIPGAANTQPTSDAEFAAYREKQNKIFDSSKDLVAQLSDLKFY